MLRLLPTLVMLWLCLGSGSVACAAAGDDLPSLLRRLCELRTLDHQPLNTGTLSRFYRQREYRPAWSDGTTLTPAAEELLATLPTAGDEGLDPRRYHLLALIDHVTRWRSAPTPHLAAEVDLLLSDAFLRIAADFQHGSIDPAAADPDWHIPDEAGDGLRILNQALASTRIRDSLRALLPTNSAYAALRSAYADYRQRAAAGGWPRLRLKQTLHPGDSGPEIFLLRQRLISGGELGATASSGASFDDELATAVQHFQTRHGLIADGVVGPATLAALNVPAVERVRQLRVNLERWRWLPRQLGDRYLLVNLPAFRLELIEAEQTVLAMRVIVGQPRRHTPAFVGRMTHLVLNPYWEVPHHLAVADLLPKIRKDPDYLNKNDFTVLGDGNREIDPASIDWTQLSAENFPYHLRQSPCAKNALGRIKFIFPNPYTIYLHDTPTRQLFEREQRSFSSGCIRIEEPLELALLLLRGSPLASRPALEAALEESRDRSVPLPVPVPVYLLYVTAWVEDNGSVQFRPDLYQRDQRVAAALERL